MEGWWGAWLSATGVEALTEAVNRTMMQSQNARQNPVARPPLEPASWKTNNLISIQLMPVSQRRFHGSLDWPPAQRPLLANEYISFHRIRRNESGEIPSKLLKAREK